jgi:hypothetical protein
MHDSTDGYPDDLGEVEKRLRAERAELSAIEADEMRRRIVRRAERRPGGRMARARRRGTAIALISGAIVSSGGTAVLAATSLTGGSTTSLVPSTYHPPSSGGCQYHPSWTKTFTFKKDKYTTITVTVSYDCMTNKFTITITCSKPITYYYCNGKKVTVPANTKTTTFVLDPGVHSLTVTSGGATSTFPLLLVP